MLLCTDKKLHFIDEQYVRLRKNIEGVEYYFYLDTYMYRQAIVLRERFNFADEIKKKLNIGDNEHVNVSETTFREQTPEELWIFTPFIGLLSKLTGKVITDVIEQCGYLHQLSRAIDFAAYVSAHPDIRLSLKDVLGYLDEYHNSYNNILVKYAMDSVEYENVSLKAVKEVLGELVLQTGSVKSMSPNYVNTENEEMDSKGAEEDDKDESVVSREDPFALFNALADEMEMEETSSSEAEEKVGSMTTEAEFESKLETEEEPVEELSEEEKALDELLKKMGGV